MVSSPKPGGRVQLWYAAARRPIAPHHGELVTVVAAAKGRGPRNHLVRTAAGELVCVPAGNLRHATHPTEADPCPVKPLPRRTRRRPSA